MSQSYEEKKKFYNILREKVFDMFNSITIDSGETDEAVDVRMQNFMYPTLALLVEKFDFDEPDMVLVCKLGSVHEVRELLDRAHSAPEIFEPIADKVLQELKL